MNKRVAIVVCLLMLLELLFTGCTAINSSPQLNPSTAVSTASPDQSTDTVTTSTPSNQDFIADRHITVKHFQGGVPQYADYKNAYAYKKIKELTGISYDVEFSQSDNYLQDLTLALAAGDLPDIISVYCEGTNTSAQAAVLNVLVKAGKDGMFADIKPYLPNTVKYKLFLDTEYLTKDAAENIVMRSDFNGNIYLLQMGLPRQGVPSDVWIGAMQLYIRNDIVKALGIDPSSIQTKEDLYNLALKIKAGNFMDGNGKPCPAPIGPPIWAGANTSAYYPELDFGNSSGFEKDSSGNVKNVMMTDYPYQTVNYIRKMLADGLIAKEAFTMPGPQATEAFSNATYPIVYMHAFSQSWDGGSDVLQSKNPEMMYVAVGPMKNHLGSVEKLVIRRGESVMAVSAKTKNPDQIIRFMDWIATRLPELRLNYGENGINYTLVDETSQEYLKYTQPDPWDDGKVPILTPEWAAQVKANPDLAKALPALWIGTNYTVDSYKDIVANLGPADPNDPVKKWYDYGRELLKKAAPQVKVVDGIPISGALDGFSGIKTLKPILDSYNDTLIKAYFAGSDDEAKSILDGYKKQLETAGITDLCNYLQDLDRQNPGKYLFYLTN